MIVCVLTACRPPRKTITLYFTFPFSVIISSRVLYALSCPIVSKPLSKRISYLAIPHPNTRRRQRPAPTIHTQCRHHSYNVIKAQQKCPPDHKSIIQVHVLCTFSSCLPAHMYPPTYLCFTKRSIRNISSERSAKSPHGCLCHLTPIHSQVGSDATGVATLGGERWTCLEQACSGLMERLRRLAAAAAVQHHCNTRWRTLHFFSFLFFSLLGSWSGKTMAFLSLQGTT